MLTKPWIWRGAVILSIGVIVTYQWVQWGSSGIESQAVHRIVAHSSAEYETQAPRCMVQLEGAVVRPGIYWVTANQRVGDLIAQAGGVLPTARLATIQLSALLHDGAVIRVPFNRAIATQSPVARVVSLNLSDAKQLQQVSGLGPALAKRIVRYREQHGPFQSIDDVRLVTGVGPGLMNRIRDQLVLN